MSWPVLTCLLVASALLLVLERLGFNTTLRLHFKGDMKRETEFLAQWGQSVATPLAAILIWQLDPPHHKAAVVLVFAVLGASVSCLFLKRFLGRVRPNRAQAGKFLGPSFIHANWRESFPSSHSACAIALSVYLANLYPQAAWTFWALGLCTASLRYLLDAHWPSDVVAGVALGYVVAHWWLSTFAITAPPS